MHIVKTETATAKHTVSFYDSDKVIGPRRYNEFTKHTMVKSQVGSTIEDFDKRVSRGIMYLNDGDVKSTGIELTNLRQCFWNALQSYDPIGMAGATMVHSIDGVVYKDYTKAGLNIILDKLEEVGFTKQQLDDTVELLKKK